MRTILLGALALAACAETPRDRMPVLAGGPCRVDERVRIHWIGKEFRMREREAIRLDANAPTARVLRPEDAATMDFREDRLNIRLSDDGKIDALDCG